MNTGAVAAVVEREAQTIAESACSNLLQAHGDLEQRFGDDARRVWVDHLNTRTLELAAALAAGDYRLFSSRLAWSRTAMHARELTETDLQFSLNALRSGVEGTLQGEPRQAALEVIDHALRELAEQPDAGPETSRLDAGIGCDRLALHYVQSVVAGNVNAGIQQVLDAVARGLPIYDAYLKVLLPAQQEVGRLWHLNEISVAEEHLVSYTTQRLMALLTTRLPRKPDNGRTVIAAAVSGNVHDIGIRAISYLLEFEGWRTIYLGSDIPRQELPNAIEGFSADLLMLSVALTTQIQSTKRAITGIRTNCKHPVKIMVGGNGLAGQPELYKQLGADGYAATAPEALTLALELTDPRAA